VESCSPHRIFLTYRYLLRIDRDKLLGWNMQDMILRISISLSVQIKISMICQVQDGSFVGGSPKLDNDLILVCQFIGYIGLQFTRKPFFSVGRYIIEVYLFLETYLPVPYTFMKTSWTTMQAIRTIILCQCIFLPFKGKLSIGNTITKSS